MKPEFSEVVFPATKLHTSASTDSSIRLIGREKNSNMDKCFITAAIIFAFIIGILTTGFIVRYEDKLSNYEHRISFLEKELSGIHQKWEEEYGPSVSNAEDFAYEIPHTNLYGSDETSDDYTSREATHSDEEKDHHGQEVRMDMTRSRKKRQIPLNDLPTFGPNVQRTADGVPILEQSYLDRGGNEPARPAAAFYNRFEQPSTTTDSEGLRLYEGLLATGGRNEPRSLDYERSLFGQNGIQPHHRTSAAWSERESRRHTSRSSSSIQLKSGDSQTSLPSGFGESTGPNFSEEVTYRRSSSGSRSNDNNNGSGRRTARKCVTTTVNEDGSTTTANGSRRCITNGAASTSSSNSAARHSNANYESRTSNTQTRSTNTATRNLQSSSSNLNRGSSLSSDNPTSQVTYHRRSRVPSSDFLLPTTTDSQVRSLQYPPLQRLGRGDGEVIARVLQSDNESEDLAHSRSGHSSQSASESASEQHSEHSESSSRRQGSRRVAPSRQAAQAAYKQGRKIHHHNHHSNRQRDVTTDTTTGGSGSVNIVRAEAWVETPGKPIAAHYVADVSNFTTSHRHYEGNGRLRNADGIFAAWKPSDWMETSTSGDDKNFVLNQNGVLTVKKPGLYYIYAQIHYLDEHDINGYVVQVNTTPFLQCTTMTETRTGGAKSNSCFTAGITHLKENDRILVKDIETNRYSIFKPEKSFFGLMKIGDAN